MRRREVNVEKELVGETEEEEEEEDDLLPWAQNAKHHLYPTLSYPQLSSQHSSSLLHYIFIEEKRKMTEGLGRKVEEWRSCGVQGSTNEPGN